MSYNLTAKLPSAWEWQAATPQPASQGGQPLRRAVGQQRSVGWAGTTEGGSHWWTSNPPLALTEESTDNMTFSNANLSGLDERRGHRGQHLILRKHGLQLKPTRATHYLQPAP
jgi:hypothetical protein